MDDDEKTLSGTIKYQESMIDKIGIFIEIFIEKYFYHTMFVIVILILILIILPVTIYALYGN